MIEECVWNDQKVSAKCGSDPPLKLLKLSWSRSSVDAGLFHDAKELIFVDLAIAVFVKFVNHGL